MSHQSGPTYHQVLQPVNAPPQGASSNQNVRFAGPMGGQVHPQRQRIIVQPHRPRYPQMGPRPGVRHVYPSRPGDERGGAPMEQDTKLISKQKLNLLARDVDPNAILEDEVIDFLLKLSGDFIDTVVTGSCALAKHRKSPTLDTTDIKLCLSRQWDLQIPGFPIEDQQLKKQQTGEAHKQRLQLIRKQLKR